MKTATHAKAKMMLKKVSVQKGHKPMRRMMSEIATDLAEQDVAPTKHTKKSFE